MSATAIADAVKEVFRFLREWNNADQKQKRYALKRIKRIKKATDLAEDIFFVVEDMLKIAHAQGLADQREFTRLEARYKKMVQKFNDLD
jgi:tellurite resistance protein